MVRKIQGWQIRVIRERLKMTQVNLASVLGVSPVTVSRWENEKTIPLNAFQAAIIDLALEREIPIPRLRRPTFL